MDKYKDICLSGIQTIDAIIKLQDTLLINNIKLKGLVLDNKDYYTLYSLYADKCVYTNDTLNKEFKLFGVTIYAI